MMIVFLRVFNPAKVLGVFTCFPHSRRPVLTRLWLSVIFTSISGVNYFCLRSLTKVRKYLRRMFSTKTSLFLYLRTKRRRWHFTPRSWIILGLIIFVMYIYNYLPLHRKVILSKPHKSLFKFNNSKHIFPPFFSSLEFSVCTSRHHSVTEHLRETIRVVLKGKSYSSTHTCTCIYKHIPPPPNPHPSHTLRFLVTPYILSLTSPDRCLGFLLLKPSHWMWHSDSNIQHWQFNFTQKGFFLFQAK